MNFFKTINNFCGNTPEMIRRIAMALIYSVNNNIIGLARRQMSLARKDSSLFPDSYDKGGMLELASIDANVRELEMRRAKNNAGSSNMVPGSDGGTSDAVLEEQGFDVEDPAKAAEKFVAMRTLILLETNELIKRHHLNPLQDQSVARQIIWQLDLPYRENTSKIVEAVAASGGRAKLEDVRKALHDDWVNMQNIRKNMAPELIVTAESFLCDNIDDTEGPMTAAQYYESHLAPLDKLRLLSAAWSKAQKFITVDIPSGKLPVSNMTHEIGVIATMMSELEKEAKSLLDECISEYCATYIDRGFAGLPVILHLESARKQQASAHAQLLAMPSDLEAIMTRTAELRKDQRKLVKAEAATPQS